MTPTKTVIDALRANRCEPRPSGGGYSARCPAHDDRRPSLSIDTGTDGRALIKCHAGCPTETVLDAIGLNMRCLMPEEPVTVTKTPPANSGSGVSVTATHQGNRRYESADAAVAAIEIHMGPRSAQYEYHDATGRHVGRIVRWDREEGKEIRPVSLNGRGWELKGMQWPRPLYGMPGILDAETLLVCEGEKAADAAAVCGFDATTSPHGSQAASKADWSPVRGKNVVVVPDNDAAGELYADDVANLCSTNGAQSVRIIRLWDHWLELPPGGDFADVLGTELGNTSKVRECVQQLIKDAPELPSQASPAQFREFPVGILPEPLRSFVETGAASLGCDPSFVALPLVTMLAGVVGNAVRIELKAGWSEPCIIWGAAIGESGTMKSPAQRLALRPIRELQQDEAHDFELEWKKYERELAIHKREFRQWERKGSGGDPPPDPPEPPKAVRRLVSDVTIEALALILMDNPRGVLLARDELGGWIASFDRYAGGRGGDVSHWLSMFHAEPMTVDRKSGDRKTVNCEMATVSIVGGIQPEILKRAIGQEHRENGLLARFLLVRPPRKPKVWTDSGISPDVGASIGLLIDELCSLGVNEDGSLQPLTLRLTPTARQLFIDFYNAHAREQAQLAGELSAVWSKLEGYAARLALLVHCVRWARDTGGSIPPGPVDDISMKVGIDLVRWFAAETERIYSMFGESDEQRDLRELLEWIGRRGGSITVRDLTHGLRSFRGKSTDARAALQQLVDEGLGYWQGCTRRPGRPSERFTVRSRPCPACASEVK